MNPTLHSSLLALPILIVAAVVGLFSSAALAAPTNVVLIYADDLGYGDVGTYGAKRIPTPNIDRLAKEGLRFTNAYAPSATCTPSRYAMLTGQYAWRQRGTGVLPGDASLIIRPGRTTLPSILRKAGLRTGVVGKWHLGLGEGEIDWNGEIKPGPLEIGFDESFIMAATADRVPCVFLRGHRVVGLDPKDPIQVSYARNFPGEPTGKANPEMLRVRPSHGHDMSIVNGISRIGYMKGGKTALWKDEDMADVFTGQAVRFIEENKDRPFFLYVPHSMPHVPLYVSDKFAGKSARGLFGDVIEEIDWSVGEILGALKRNGLEESTLVMFMADNGPWLSYGDHAGSAGPLREGKGTAFEGGVREPAIFRWPGKLPAGAVCHEPAITIDVLPTMAKLIGASLPPGLVLDGKDIWPLVSARADAKSPHDALYFFWDRELQAVRGGKWKLHFPHEYRTMTEKTGAGGKPGNYRQEKIGLALYDLETDPGETKDVAADHADVVKRLNALGERARQEIRPGN